MAELNGTITGNSPFSFVVRKVGETTGNRCTGACNSFPIEFTHDSGNHQYYFIVTDADGCVVDSRNIPNGTGVVNCDVVQPDFDYEFTQPVCLEGDVYQAGVIHLTNITNATRYKICYNTTTMDCGDCTVSTGTISGSSINITVDTPTVPTSRGVFLRVYNGADCLAYRDYFETMVTPNCVAPDAPDFNAAIIQPYCSTEIGGVPQNAVVQLSNIINTSRYKICYNSSVFSGDCNANCSISDGVISGGSQEISIVPPNEDVTQTNTIRFYNGSGCTNYKDLTFTIRSPKCSVNETTLITMDLQVFLNSSTARCDQPNTYQVEYDFYVTPNTIGMSENGVKARTGVTAERTLPNGNDVPNVYIAAGFKSVCGSSATPNQAIGNMFYRHVWNMSLIKAKYPDINTFTFDVFALKTKDAGTSSFSNSIRPFMNAFSGVAMVKQLYANNSNDAYRSPLYNGFPCSQLGCSDPYDQFTNTSATMPDVIYNTSISGFRKIASISYNYTTRQITWTPL